MPSGPGILGLYTDLLCSVNALAELGSDAAGHTAWPGGQGRFLIVKMSPWHLITHL